MLPLESNLSSTSVTDEYNCLGLTIERSNNEGLDWLPISRRSLKPEVITKAVVAPFLSSKAFVAIVVPSRILSIFLIGIASSLSNFKIRLIPSIIESV